MTIPDDLTLGSRQGLPEPLRVLLATHPRESWQADPGFAGLVAFWLERHMMFRRIAERLRADSEAMLDHRLAPDRYGASLSRLGSAFLQELHGHHMIEDAHYFPVLSAREPAIARGFEILDADHHALDARLAAFAERANAAIRGLEGPDAGRAGVEAFRAELVGLAALLDRHLTDEEDLVVPVILRHGAAGLG